MITKSRFLRLKKYSEKTPSNKKLKEFININRNNLEYVTSIESKASID